ncbi:hypothetical protein [Haloferula helveola]
MTGLIGGLVSYGAVYLDAESHDVWPWVAESLVTLDTGGIDGGRAIATFLTVSAVVTSAPFLFPFLGSSKLLRIFLRCIAGMAAATMVWFAHEDGDVIRFLYPLAAAPTLTFLGLCLIPGRMPPEETQAP